MTLCFSSEVGTGSELTERSPVEQRVWEALDQVMDPELDEPVTSLGFVYEWGVEDGVARVRLRLPTFFCAPNFAWLMVADAYDAVSGVEGVRVTQVTLDDFFASEEINAGVAAKDGFVDAFTGSAAGEASAELDELRLVFQRKAYVAALERVYRRVRHARTASADLHLLTLADVEPGPDLERLIRRRTDLRLPTDESSALLVDESGLLIAPSELGMWMRRAQTVRVNIEGNGAICRGLLRGRYHLEALEQELLGVPANREEESR